MEEEWRPIAGFDYYEVSNLGRVRRIQILKCPPDGPGYPQVDLFQNRKGFHFRVHAIVAETFLGSRLPHMEINHKNGDKTDNRVCNLEYVTRTGNMRHASEQGYVRHGSIHPFAKLTEQDVHRIKWLLTSNTMTRSRIGRIYHVSKSTIDAIKCEKAWKHVQLRSTPRASQINHR